MSIKFRTVSVEEAYCDQCGQAIRGLLTCFACQAKVDCAEGRHLLMLSSARTGDLMEKECLFCKAEFRVTLVIS